MKLCLGMGVALLLFGCGGGEGGIDFHDPRAPESSQRRSESSGESRDSPRPGASNPGQNGGGGSGDLIATCSGSYDCGIQLVRGNDGSCQFVVGDTAFTLEPGGTVSILGDPIGTWSGNSSSFQLCSTDGCDQCTAL